MTQKFKTPPAHFFMPSTRLRTFRLDRAIDLAGANAPMYGEDKYEIFNFVVPKKQVYIVKSFVFLAWQRINIENADEGLELLTNEQVAGAFGFTILVDGKSPIQVNTEHSRFFPLATAQNNVKNRGGYFTTVSENPDYDLLSNWWNPLLSFPVHAEKRLQVLFEILPVGTGATPIQVTDDPTVTNRVDFSGAFFAGNIMSESDFAEMESHSEL